MTKRLRILVVCMLLPAALLACNGDDDAPAGLEDIEDVPTSTAPPDAPDVPDAPTEPPAEGDIEGDASPTPTVEPEDAQSSIQDGRLEDLEVPPGSTVTWTNEDDTPHEINTITSTSEPVESGEIAPGETFQHTFQEVGVWDLVVDDGTEIWVILVE